MLLASAVSAAVAPPGSLSSCALRCLGADWDAIERAAATELRAPVAAALAGVRTRPTSKYPDGVCRGSLIRTCGRLHATARGLALGCDPRCCRQRACPACARARASKNRRELHAAMEARAVDGVSFVFATLTQPKHPHALESAREAVRRLLDTWRRATNTDKDGRAGFRERFAGGLRTTETTWAAQGDERRNGGRIRFDGFHAHLHLLLEVRAGVSRSDAAAWLQSQWLAHCEGAEPGAQCVRAARFADADELCKYVTKPLEDVAKHPAILRELFAGLHGVRLLQAFGEWQGRGMRRGWRELAREHLGESDDRGPSVPMRRGPEIGELLNSVARPVEGSTGRVPFVGRTPDDVVWIDAKTAWEAVREAFRARARGRPPPGLRSEPPC